MNTQEVEWKHYPYVAEYSPARSFIERLVLKGKQPKTVDAYARVVEDLLTYFTNRHFSHVLEADEADLDAYIAHLRQQRPKKRGRGGMVDDQIETSPFGMRRMLSDNTIAQRIVVCRLFYDFLIRNKLRSDSVNPIERGNDGRNGQHPRRGPFQKRERIPWIPSDEAWEQLLLHVIQNESARPKAMILLAYDAALRREELMLLRVDDIDWARGIITIRSEITKNGRMRYIPVSEGVLYLVRAYIDGDRRTLIAAYDGDASGPIFLSESTRNPGRSLAVGTFNEIIERIREQVGLPALTPHTLRHQRCTILKRAGVDLDDIALFAGHKSTKTTRLYIHLAPTELSERIRSKVEPFDASLRTLIKNTVSWEVPRDRR